MFFPHEAAVRLTFRFKNCAIVETPVSAGSIVHGGCSSANKLRALGVFGIARDLCSRSIANVYSTMCARIIKD